MFGTTLKCINTFVRKKKRKINCFVYLLFSFLICSVRFATSFRQKFKNYTLNEIQFNKFLNYEGIAQQTKNSLN